MSIKLTAELIEAFAGTFLSPLYDNPAPTPDFHRKAWELYCSEHKYASVAAPRGHAKSTAFTHVFGLATALFRVQDYVVVASATEELAIGHLGDIAKEFRDNDDLKIHFNIRGMLVDAKTDIIVEFTDGHRCRFVAKGSGQKMRGMKWNGKRPGLILGDDLEEDEQVESIERRQKFRQWFFRVLLPCLRKDGVARAHGTILHEDSLLAKIQKSPEWKTLLFKAHAAFDDFSDVLWPEMYDAERLQQIQASFIDIGDGAGYSQEYLNDPYDNNEAYLRRHDFLAMKPDDYDEPQVMKVGVDFAVSKADKANRTSFTVGGKTIQNIVMVRDQLVGRWDPAHWLEVFFVLQERWDVEEFIVEGGVIWNSIESILYNEMRDRDTYLNIRVVNPVRDKGTRGLSFKKRHRAGAVRFDKQADWYAAYEQELLRFTGVSQAVLDDQFDSTALLMKGFEEDAPVTEENFWAEDDYMLKRANPRRNLGRSVVTGY